MTIGPAGSARRGDGWFALVSGEQSAELNMCALTPGAGVAAAEELVGVLGPDLPAVIFRSQQADPGTTTRLERLGFSTAQEREALMVCLRPPAPAAGPFRIRRAAKDEIDHGIAISSDAQRSAATCSSARSPHTPRRHRALAGLGRRGADQRGVAAPCRRRHRCLVNDDAAPAHQRQGAASAARC